MEDWEAIAVGPCDAGSCVFVGDIGDNDAGRRTITVYRFPEPTEPSGPVDVPDVFHARYPDGAHDAETLLVGPSGELFVVTKGDTGPIAIFRFPAVVKPGSTVDLVPIGKPREGGKAAANARITDGAVSPNGQWVALRTNQEVTLHRADNLLTGNWQVASRIPLERLGEPQGEGIGFGDDATLYVLGEGGGKARPGTFARVTCAP